MLMPFDTAVDLHGAMVLRVCRAVLGAGADADDAWSETFLSALRAWPELPDSTDVEAWLVRVAHRRSVDVVRKHARSDAPGGLGEEVGTTRDHTPAVHSPPADAGVEDPVWQLVAALPEKQRRCVAYRYLGGLSYAEIADEIGGSAAAARRAAADGIAALRRSMVSTEVSEHVSERDVEAEVVGR